MSEPDPDERRQAAGVGLLIIVTVVLAGLIAGTVGLALRDHHRRSANSRSAAAAPEQQAALAAARGESVALTTLSYESASADLNRVLAGATGALRDQFDKEKQQLPATLAKTKSTSRGSVLSSALTSLNGNRAQALVAVDATVSGTDTGSAGVLKHYRMVVTLQRVGGKWLASDVGFAGVPQ